MFASSSVQDVPSLTKQFKIWSVIITILLGANTIVDFLGICSGFKIGCDEHNDCEDDHDKTVLYDLLPHATITLAWASLIVVAYIGAQKRNSKLIQMYIVSFAIFLAIQILFIISMGIVLFNTFGPSAHTMSFDTRPDQPMRTASMVLSCSSCAFVIKNILIAQKLRRQLKQSQNYKPEIESTEKVNTEKVNTEKTNIKKMNMQKQQIQLVVTPPHVAPAPSLSIQSVLQLKAISASTNPDFIQPPRFVLRESGDTTFYEIPL